MPYSRITRTEYGSDAIAYARGDGTGHNGAEARNVYTLGVNMLPDEVVSFEEQMRPYWERAHFRHTIQIDRCIVSFAKSEIDPDKPEDLALALEIGRQIALRNAPDNQTAIFLQTDGEGGLAHLHLDTNDVNMSDGKGINPLAYAHWHFEQIVDEVCQQYFDLATPEQTAERVSRSVQGVRIKNEKIKAANELEQLRAAEEGREPDPDKIKPEHYIWQDDLKRRIKTAATKATDEDSFAAELRASGVDLVPHKAKDGTVSYIHPATKKQPAHYTYELTDTSGFSDKIPRNLKSKSFKLGTNYQPETIAKQFGIPSVVWGLPEDDIVPKVDFYDASQERDAPSAEVPVVVPDVPHKKPKKAKKPTPKIQENPPKRSLEDSAMADARNRANVIAFAVMRQVYGWEQDASLDELDRQHQARDAAFIQFTTWRVNKKKQLATEGKKLPSIYIKDKDTSYISVHRDEFERQFTEFLTEHDSPEKRMDAQKQPEQGQAAQVKSLRTEQPKQTKPENLSRADLAERARREIAKGLSASYFELQRMNRKNERRWAEQEREQDGEEKP